jgi:hypothetical protein
MAKQKTAALTSVLDITEVLDLTVPVPFKYSPQGSDKTFIVNQDVYVERITSDLIEEITAAAEKSEAEALQGIISGTVKGWDVVINGQPLGTDLATLKKLPLTFLTASGEAIVALWQGRPPKGSPSQTTSEQVERAAPSPDGI